MQIIDTNRLRIRWLDAGDAEFILELVNEPSWIRFIGDKGIRTREDAVRYIENGLVAMYERTGFGLYGVESKASGTLLGICGLIKRNGLDDVDLGFAFLSRFWRNGYAYESAAAVTSFGLDRLGMRRIVAILARDNERSCRLLERLGFRFERTVRLSPNDEELLLYAVTVA